MERNVKCEGMMPNQAEGTIGGNPFYFRARHGYWEIFIVKPGCDPVMPPLESVLFHKDGEDGYAGWWDDFSPRVHALLDEFEAGGKGDLAELRKPTPEEVSGQVLDAMHQMLTEKPGDYQRRISKLRGEQN